MSSTEPSVPDPAPLDVQREVPPRLVFRHSALGILAAVLFLICALPLMLSVPFFWLVVLVPIGFVVWLVRVRTTVDGDTVTARTVTGSRSVAWDDIASLRLGKRSGLMAVLGDDTALPLPAVHLRDLPALAIASGGRVPDPTGD
ncbi:MAG: PH domain-containing protein [Pseudonocardia sp.]|nr:PH domain-containing protein [Pseudonocardia sp.]